MTMLNEAEKLMAGAARGAARMIPPAWPLSGTVAVNPFLGQSAESLSHTAERLARTAGIRVTMPRQWYRDRIAQGRITDRDLNDALAASPHRGKPAGLARLKSAAETPRPEPKALETVADLAAGSQAVDWPGIIGNCLGEWAASHFDAGQALWSASGGDRAWTSWRTWAAHDLTPEIHGLKGFGAYAASLPDSPHELMAKAAWKLGLERDMLQTYFHQLLLSLGGWAQYARYLQWQAELEGGSDGTIEDLLAIRLVWELYLYEAYEPAIGEAWKRIAEAHARPVSPDEDQIVDEILQEAAERAAQRDLGETLAAGSRPTGSDGRPALQAAFCIDVRSEIFRRNLEEIDPAIQTIGFAGFFGLPVGHHGFASDQQEVRMPVLLKPALQSRTGDGGPAAEALDRTARYVARARRAWGRFKLAAVSSFAFVEAAGPVYAGKLLRDSFGLVGGRQQNDPMPRFEPDPTADEKAEMAEGILRAMSLTEDFARVVLLTGHGADVVNNPHASALACGACGGYSGEVNARLLASLLNDKAVRARLADRGIEVPGDTLFVAALHDTTTDRVRLFDTDCTAPDHQADLACVRVWLDAATRRARGERAPRLPGADRASDIPARARNWAEIRPEWGLAGCRAFIAAPRERTAGRRLRGAAFLHDYDWLQDRDGGYRVLELIMTAPVVVASWISLQYYGSSVAPETFGAGNKLLHNVVGGIGVLEGNGGAMRAGLPWQSVHDGEVLVHEPLRLTVCIEAPVEAMTEVLRRHPEVRRLFDNRWLHLLALDGEGRFTHRYTGGFAWQEMGTRDKTEGLMQAA